ncbi:MAG TPA: hypothetical protein VJ768_04540 [Anaerolineales bacterium]|nr:hypothetical protein [Anaerolineales bacterium]
MGDSIETLINWLTANEALLSSLAALIAILGAGYVAARFVLRRRVSGPSEQVVSEFRKLWPKLSEFLHKDIEQAIEFTEQGRAVVESSGFGPTLNFQPPKVSNGNQINGFHWQTIRANDKTFARRLTQFSDAALELRRISNDRNQMVFRGQTQTSEFASTVHSLYQASRKLELVADALNDQVKHFDDVIGTSPG